MCTLLEGPRGTSLMCKKILTTYPRHSMHAMYAYIDPFSTTPMSADIALGRYVCVCVCAEFHDQRFGTCKRFGFNDCHWLGCSFCAKTASKSMDHVSRTSGLRLTRPHRGHWAACGMCPGTWRRMSLRGPGRLAKSPLRRGAFLSARPSGERRSSVRR